MKLDREIFILNVSWYTFNIYYTQEGNKMFKTSTRLEDSDIDIYSSVPLSKLK